MVKIPNFLKGNKKYEELISNSDLTWDFVYQCCLHIGVIKQISISDQTIEEWYKEFLKSYWSKKDFLKQYEALKNMVTYARIDLALWTKTERMYNEIELRNAIKIEVQSLISKGYRLKKELEKDTILTEEQKKQIRLSEYALQLIKYNLKSAREIEEIKEQEELRAKEILKDREKRILKLSDNEKNILLKECLDKKIILAETELEKRNAKVYLHKYADLISSAMIDGIESNS